MVRTSSITVSSMVGIVGCAPAVDEKVLCVFGCLFFTLWNYKVCDNGNAMKQYYYQNIMCHCMQEGLWLCTYTQLFCGPPKFFHGGKFIP